MRKITILNPDKISGVIFNDWVITYFGRNLSFDDNYSWEVRYRTKANPITGIGSITIMRDLSLLNKEVMIQYDYQPESGLSVNGRVYVETDYLKNPNNLMNIVKEMILDKLTI
jgi:hypothetical protein